MEFLSALFCCVGDHGCRESSPRSMNDVISKSNIKVQGILQAKQTGINLRCPLIRIIGCIKVEHQEVKTNALMVDPPLVDVKKMEPCSPSFGDLLHCTTKKEQRAVGGACVKNATSDGSTFCSNNDPFCNSLATCSLICVSPYNQLKVAKLLITAAGTPRRSVASANLGSLGASFRCKPQAIHGTLRKMRHVFFLAKSDHTGSDESQVFF